MQLNELRFHYTEDFQPKNCHRSLPDMERLLGLCLLHFIWRNDRNLLIQLLCVKQDCQQYNVQAESFKETFHSCQIFPSLLCEHNSVSVMISPMSVKQLYKLPNST